MEGINSRIEKIRKYLGLSQEEFGRRIGITRSSVSGLESGRRTPSDQTKAFICREFSVRMEWLENGGNDEDMFLPTSGSLLEKLRAQYQMSDFDARVVETYLEMEPEQRAALNEFILKLSDKAPAADDPHALLDEELALQKKAGDGSTISPSSDVSGIQDAG